MTLLAVRLIDLAIFGSLGALWIGGAVFIVVLYRWILRFEASTPPSGADVVPKTPEPTPTLAPTPELASAVPVPQLAAASYRAMASHP
ncbi:MAG: hypothetical protein AAGF11_44425 [Myxococcota bacterium]